MTELEGGGVRDEGEGLGQEKSLNRTGRGQQPKLISRKFEKKTV